MQSQLKSTLAKEFWPLRELLDGGCLISAASGLGFHKTRPLGVVAAWRLGGPLSQQAWVLALACKEIILMNLDQQNLAALEHLSRWKLPET